MVAKKIAYPGHLAIVLLLTVLPACLAAQRTDKKLFQQINTLLQQFGGDVGIYVHDLKKNRVVAINADAIFPTASMIKIPIAVGVMDHIKKGNLAYHQELIYKDSLLYAGVDLLGSFRNNEKIELSKVIMLMLSLSDNTASLWLQSLAGGGIHINHLMEQAGLTITRVNSRTKGRDSARKEFGWGQTSPREMALLMEKLVRGEIISPESSATLIRLLGRNYWDEQALSQLPADVFVASKNGAVDASRSEVLYVNGQKGAYIFCICSKNNKDTSWGNNNEAWQLTQKISKLIWERYH